MRKTAIVDIGASPIEGPPTYLAMLEAGLCTVVGFEPQPVQLAMLQKTAGPDETYRHEAIADGKMHTLYVAAYPGMTSILPIDRVSLNMYQLVGTGSRIVDTLGISTSKLDDVIFPEQHCDFLRMDVQGSEAMVLDNAHETLKNAVAIQLEMSWIPVYHGQLNIGEMDLKLRSLGFMPHKCVGVRSRAVANSSSPQESQLLEGDFTYIRDLRSEMTAEQLYHLGQLAWYVFQSGDLNAHCAERLKQMRKAA